MHWTYFLLAGNYFSVCSMAEGWKGFWEAASVTWFPSALPTPPTAVAPKLFGKWGNCHSLTWHGERQMLVHQHHSNSSNSWQWDGKSIGDYNAKHLTVLDSASKEKVQFIYSTFISLFILLPFKLPWRYMNLPRDGTLPKSKRLELLELENLPPNKEV